MKRATVMTAGAMVVVMTSLLTGCAKTEPVVLTHPASGVTTRCGPYGYGRVGVEERAFAYKRLRACIGDYRRQGYERVQD
jgi:hypothetical protein